MGLEFIDISRDDEMGRFRERNTSNEVNVSNRRNTSNARNRTNAGSISSARNMPNTRNITAARNTATARRPPQKRENYKDPDSGAKGRRTHSRPATYGDGAVRRRPVDPRMQRERIRRRRARRRKKIAARATVLVFLILLIVLAVFLLYKLIAGLSKKEEPGRVFNSNVVRREVIKANDTERPPVTENFLTVNEYSRPGEELKKIKNVFVHYTANKGTSAAQNRSYFENLGTTGETSASAHFIIGYEGEIIQCIPLNEIAYAVMGRNYDSVSIECCYLEEDGKFTDATYRSLIQLSAWLLREYKLAPEDMRRHYDEGGKKCPLYYVEHEEAWQQFLYDLEQYIMENQV